MLYDYSDAQILASGTITVSNTETVARPNNVEIYNITKSCGLFTDCTSEINNTQIDNVKYIDRVIPLYCKLIIGIMFIKHLEVYGNTIEMKQF